METAHAIDPPAKIGVSPWLHKASSSGAVVSDSVYDKSLDSPLCFTSELPYSPCLHCAAIFFLFLDQVLIRRDSLRQDRLLVEVLAVECASSSQASSSEIRIAQSSI